MGEAGRSLHQARIPDDAVAIDRAVLGGEIRTLRKARGKTLAGLALETGRSTSFLSQVERGRAEMSISDMKRMAQALEVPLGWFFVSESKPAAEASRVVREGERRRLGTVTEGLIEELLSPNIGGPFETFLTTIAPGAILQPPVLRDTIEEGYIAKGRLDLWIGEHLFELSAGDSFRIAREPFHWINRGDQDVVIVWIISPPTY